jgi:phosphonate transport system substrate-binding protein
MKRTILAALALVPLTLGLAACGSSDDNKSASSATCPGGKIRFGIEPYEDPAKLTPAYEHLAKALGEKLDCPVELKIVQDYSAEVLAMQNGKLEMAQFGPLGYVFASERADAKALASFGTADGKLSSYTAGIWVPKDSEIRSAADLKGKSLALAEPGSTSGDALPRQALQKAGLGKSDVKVNYAGGHPEALLALTNKKVDAAEINSQQLAAAKAEGSFNPADYRRIWTSAPIPNDPVTVSGKLDPAFKKTVKKALLGLDPKDVQAIGKFLDVDPAGPMTAVDTSTYKPLFDLAKELHLTEKDV